MLFFVFLICYPSYLYIPLNRVFIFCFILFSSQFSCYLCCCCYVDHNSIVVVELIDCVVVICWFGCWCCYYNVVVGVVVDIL